MISSPIALFDGGMGCYLVAETIRKAAPHQDLVCLADRASFPYGGKSPEALFACVTKAISYLAQHYTPSAVIVASNAPSILLFKALQEQFQGLSLFGVFPPIQEACSRTKTGGVGVLGVKSLIESAALSVYITEQKIPGTKVVPINASPLVDLVETGIFLRDPQATQKQIQAFFQGFLLEHPALDTFTLSSTHLPWLLPFFRDLLPQVQFLDPMEHLLAQLPLSNQGAGNVIGLVTEDSQKKYPFGEFQTMLSRLRILIPLQLITLS